MNEITVEIREGGQISIQGAGILNKKEEVKAILEKAVNALEKQPEEAFRNELVYKS